MRQTHVAHNFTFVVRVTSSSSFMLHGGNKHLWDISLRHSSKPVLFRPPETRVLSTTNHISGPINSYQIWLIYSCLKEANTSITTSVSGAISHKLSPGPTRTGKGYYSLRTNDLFLVNGGVLLFCCSAVLLFGCTNMWRASCRPFKLIHNRYPSLFHSWYLMSCIQWQQTTRHTY